LICQRAADKISGGRSPNDQAFESPQRTTGKPHVRGVSGAPAGGIQTACSTASRAARTTRKPTHAGRIQEDSKTIIQRDAALQ